MDIDYSNIRPEDFRTPDYDSLIKFRIRRILMICSNYDAFIMEEDGQIESKVYKEYVGLNMSDPPTFEWAKTADQTRNNNKQEQQINIKICKNNEKDNQK